MTTGRFELLSSVVVTELLRIIFIYVRLEDLIIGAPLYTKIEKASAGVKSTYEIGKVYVYYQDSRVKEKFD